MPVQLFVGRSAEGLPAAPDYSHEMRALIDILRQVWDVFHHHQPYYAVIANMHDPSLDLMIISERGIGVMELKHYFGKISCRSDEGWYAGPKKMDSGVKGKGFNNPHEQVQKYAEEIRQKLVTPPPYQAPWLPGKTIDWKEFKFSTAVCFTHPNADLSGLNNRLQRTCRPITLPWENFSILKIEQISEWAASLRFEVGAGRAGNFTRHRFEPAQIKRILTELFQLTEWAEMETLMPTGHPFAILSRIENEIFVQDFSIIQDITQIGRDISSCEITVPESFYLTSRAHARISRMLDGVYIEDLGSTNGTFVNGKQIKRRTLITEGSRITLGRAGPEAGVCEFQISFKVHDAVLSDATQKL
jgi:hypothetical protein